MIEGKDGKEHINIYSQGNTKLGKQLSNFYHSPIKIPSEGTFASIEAYWYWLLSYKDDEAEELKSLSGFEAKKLGRELLRPEHKLIRQKESFKNKILKATLLKIKSYPKIYRKLVNSSLPFEHYYTYESKVVEPNNCQWLIDGIEKIRDHLKSKMNAEETKGDLFSVEDSDPIFAHCVSSDGEMDAGVAKQFVEKFGNEIRLSVKDFGVGEAAPYNSSKGKVYNLITKENYWEKPTYKNIKRSLKSLKTKMVENGEKKIYMPRIASGLDGKDWNKIWNKIRKVFEDTQIQIIIKYL